MKASEDTKFSNYLQSGNILKDGNFIFTLLWPGIRRGRCSWSLQNPSQPLLSTTPEILHVIISPSRQIRGDSSPFVPKFCLQIYHHPLFLGWKLAPAIKPHTQTQDRNTKIKEIKIPPLPISGQSTIATMYYQQRESKTSQNQNLDNSSLTCMWLKLQTSSKWNWLKCSLKSWSYLLFQVGSKLINPTKTTRFASSL